MLYSRSRGKTRDGEFVVETGYRDVLADWRVRLHLDTRRSVHEQLGFCCGRSRVPATRTLAIEVIKNLLTNPDLTKGWIPYGVRAEELRRQNGFLGLLLFFLALKKVLISAEAGFCSILVARFFGNLLWDKTFWLSAAYLYLAITLQKQESWQTEPSRCM